MDIAIWRKFNPNIRHKLREELNIPRTGSFIIESPSNRILDDGVTQRDLDSLTIKTLQDFAESTEEDAEMLLQIIIDKRYGTKTKVEGGTPSGHEENTTSNGTAEESSGTERVSARKRTESKKG